MKVVFMSIQLCDTIIIHEKTIKEVQEKMIDENQLTCVSQFFKAISDPTRIKILYALEASELCVCDLSVIMNMTQSAISHQLKTLKDANLVQSKRSGKMMIYGLADQHVHDIFRIALMHTSICKP
jgi:ArsR family transcriptional regulator, lead/cadmium/zinc/bismuth-responsive transcriptional repressor